MRAHRGRAVHRMTGMVAHQRKAAGEHAAIGQRSEQLAAMGHVRIEPLQQRIDGASRTVGQAIYALTRTGDLLVLRLRVGKTRCLQPRL